MDSDCAAEGVIEELFGRAESVLYTIADAAVSSSDTVSTTKQSKDWLSGITYYMKSVLKRILWGVELVIPDCCEDREVVPQKTYFGGHEGIGEYVWYRTTKKLHGSALMDIFNASDDVHICGKTLTYIPSLDDVGAYLALCWVPIRADGKRGNPLVSICDVPVMPALPVVSNVHLKELSLGVYTGKGEYFGGFEGSSLFSWYRETAEGTIILINGACSSTYEVTDSEYTCWLLFGYTPVRSDSVIGELRLSEPTGIILPETELKEGRQRKRDGRPFFPK